jgi:elongation factor Ts
VVSAEMVKALRERTGAPMMECKRALEETGGDAERAVEVLRRRGIAKAADKAGREASEGLIDAYIHLSGRIGVLVEVNCETDFVANTPDFRQLVHDLAMHIAAASPRWIRREEVPAEVIESERAALAAEAEAAGKPPAIVEKIVSGRLDKFYQAHCLLEQPFVKNPDETIDQVIKAHIAKLGEQIVVRRFVRFERGQRG